MIFHIADHDRWQESRGTGAYTASSRGLELADQGFIHLCTADQVSGVAARFYTDATNLVLLHIDEALLTAPLVYESVPGQPAPFPHLFGPLNVDAVVNVEPFTP